MSGVMAVDVVCAGCRRPAVIIIDLGYLKQVCEEGGFSEEEASAALVADLESGRLACPSCMAERN